MANDTALGNWLTTQWAHTPRAFQVEVEGARIACLGWNMDSVFLPGLVLVHGFRAHARWWDHIAPSFTDRYRVVALNLSGMGDSDRREAYSRAQNGREILAVAAACGVPSAEAPAPRASRTMAQALSLVMTSQTPSEASTTKLPA